MAKLCRFYVSGAGNESARFNQLLVDLRDRHEWNPQNTIIWLRNGGGKTTLISLFYCIFIPKVSDFLGLKNGKGAKLEDFVRENELAIIATEWQPSNPGAPRRTVGVVVLKTPRELRRSFFSFNATKTTSFSFQSLPVRGLSEPARSYDAFRETLNEAMREHPAIELVLTENQTSWIKHLDEIGLDTELFRTHLIMNAQEGGAADIFKIKSPEDFVKKFLHLAYDESSTEEIEKGLQGFKEKRESAPHYSKSIEFGETLVRLLTPFANDVAKRHAARLQQAALHGEVAEVRFAVQSKRAELESALSNLKEEIIGYTHTIDEKSREHRRLSGSARGYRTLGKRKKVEETRKEYESALETEKKACLELAVLRAAKEFATVRALDNVYAALVRERQKLHEELRPQLEDLQNLGARLKAAWTRRIADLTAAHELAKEQVQTKNTDIIERTTQQAELLSGIVAAEKDMEAARKAIRAYEEAHRRLRDVDAILANEKASDALVRLKSEAWTLANSIESTRVALAALQSRVKASRATLLDLNTSYSQAEAGIERAETKLTGEEIRRIQIERLPIVAEVVVGGEVNIRNPYLRSRLEEIAEEAQAKLIQIGVLSADDRRDDVSLDKFGLLAPSADVEALISRLAASGIKTAIPAYHWLAEHFSVEKAAAFLQSNPAACSGILVQDPKELEKVRTELKNAAIRSPIVIFSSNPTIDTPVPTDVVVVGPEEAGMYSKQQAVYSQSVIASRRDERSVKQGEFESRRASAQTAATRIGDYLKAYPEERVQVWQEELAEARRQLTEYQQAISAAKIEIDTLEEEIAEKSTLQTKDIDRKSEVAKLEGNVSDFIRDYEQNIEFNRDQFTKLSAHVEELKYDQEDNRIRIRSLRDVLAELEKSERNQEFACREAQREERLLPPEFIGDHVPSESGRPEDIQPEFNIALASYRGLLKGSDLDGRIDAKSEELTGARRELERASRGVPSDRIANASEAADIDSEISDQESLTRTAGEVRAVAKQLFDAAARENPTDSDFKAGSLVDASRASQPETSDECVLVASEYEEQAEAIGSEIDATKQTKMIAERSKDRTDTELIQYKGVLTGLPEVQEATNPHPQFSGIAEHDASFIGELAGRISKNASELGRLEKSIDGRFESQIHPHILLPDYDAFRIEFRDRLKYLHKEDIAERAAELTNEISVAVATCKNDLEHEEQHRQIIIEQLDDIVQRATKLLSQASEVSKMPAESGAWAHQPFLRINVPKKSDKAERAHYLNAAMQSWYDTNSIPHGHSLAFQCLLAVCGTKMIGIKMLKPEYVPTATAHDIVEMMKFSDGEKLTAAIVLYCVLVRLRARQRAKQFLFTAGDSGLLLLDNPIGKATLDEFVDLQVRVARMMGVQLVYATGIGAESALKHFSHIVRLKNSVRGRTNNDHYVTLDEKDHVVDGVTLGIAPNGTDRN